jgi:hypothetical protein
MRRSDPIALALLTIVRRRFSTVRRMQSIARARLSIVRRTLWIARPMLSIARARLWIARPRRPKAEREPDSTRVSVSAVPAPALAHAPARARAPAHALARARAPAPVVPRSPIAGVWARVERLRRNRNTAAADSAKDRMVFEKRFMLVYPPQV